MGPCWRLADFEQAFKDHQEISLLVRFLFCCLERQGLSRRIFQHALNLQAKYSPVPAAAACRRAQAAAASPREPGRAEGVHPLVRLPTLHWSRADGSEASSGKSSCARRTRSKSRTRTPVYCSSRVRTVDREPVSRAREVARGCDPYMCVVSLTLYGWSLTSEPAKYVLA